MVWYVNCNSVKLLITIDLKSGNPGREKEQHLCVLVSQKFIVIHLKISAFLEIEITTSEQEVLFNVFSLQFVLVAFQYYFIHRFLMIYY